MASYQNWMEQNSAAIQTKKLREICLPSSHDSATNQFVAKLDPNILPADKKQLQKVFGQLQTLIKDLNAIPLVKQIITPQKYVNDQLISAIEGLSQANDRTVLQQLEEGIRCLDLRIYYERTDDTYHCYHGLISVPLGIILAYVQSFCQKNQGEILYITFSHFANFDLQIQGRDIPKKFNDLVKSALGVFAYKNTGSNNPFEATYNDILGITEKPNAPGQFNYPKNMTSKVILVNEKGNSSEFWGSEYCPPNDTRHQTVIKGKYTASTDKQAVIKEQKQNYDSNNGSLPFALYMTLTPANNDYISIIVYRVVTSISRMDFPLPSSVNLVLKNLISGYKPPTWRTLRQLSHQINVDMLDTIRTIQPENTQPNQISFIYCDFYQESSVVQEAIKLSGGTAFKHPALSKTFGIVSLRTGLLNLFGIGSNGKIYRSEYNTAVHQWQANFNNAPINVAFVDVFAVNNGENANLETFALSEDGNLYHTFYGANGWGSWNAKFNQQPDIAFSKITGIVNGDTKATELFALDNQGLVYYCWFYNTWSSWTVGYINQGDWRFSELFPFTNKSNGNTEMLALDFNGAIYHSWYQGKNGWSDWKIFNGQKDQVYESIWVGENSSKKSTEVFGIDAAGILHHCSFDGAWNGWTANWNGQLNEGFVQITSVTNAINANMEVYAIGKNGTLYECFYENGWSTWEKDFNSAPSMFTIHALQWGNLNLLLSIGDDETVYECLYDGNWNAWEAYDG